MNERYQADKRQGVTRKSAASAKPKAKAAASVTYSSPKKDPKAKKAEIKAQRKAESERQREIDRKYYTPDTDRYKKLRRIWWASLIGAVACTAGSWLLRGVQPAWLAMACLVLAYILIIFAFYIDFSKIRKERRAYQTRMMALEVEEKKKAERRRKSARRQGQKEDDASDEDPSKAAEGSEGGASDEDSQKPPKKRAGLFARKAASKTQE